MKRVFIISPYPLFGRGIESLLRQETQIDIISQETDIVQAVQQIKELEPDVVILDTSSPASDLIPVVMQILEINSEIKVIGLSLRDNNLYIYRARQYMVESVKDLVAAIEEYL